METKKEETMAEWKIGEIRQVNGEWYQCLKSNDMCNGCAGKFQPYSFCHGFGECVGKIFKRLKKVGEPFSDYCPSGRVIYFQSYKCYQKPIYTGNIICWADDTTISIKIKENMEEKKLNLKPFDLEAAKAGKPICTRDGRKARIICFDAKCNLPIVALITQSGEDESLARYNSNGSFTNLNESDCDLMMLTEKKEGWVNVYRDCNGMNITNDDNIYSSKEAAIASAQIIDRDNYVATTIINWEE